MKKFISLLITMLMIVSSCSAERYVSLNSPEREFSTYEILYNQYPELVPYYEEGVLKVTSVNEVRTEVGYIYDIKYKFIKRYLYNEERYLCLQENYPELYALYLDGIIRIRSVYKYVDDDLTIRCHVTYSRAYEYYYSSVPLIYPYGHRYHNPRPLPPPRVHQAPPPPRNHNNPPPPQARPNDRQRPEGNVRPNNPPRHGGDRPHQTKPNNPPKSEGNVRPNNPSRQSNGGSQARPNSQPRSSGGTPQVRSNSNPSRSSSSSQSKSGGSSTSRSGSGNSGGRRR